MPSLGTVIREQFEFLGGFGVKTERHCFPNLIFEIVNSFFEKVWEFECSTLFQESIDLVKRVETET